MECKKQKTERKLNQGKKLLLIFLLACAAGFFAVGALNLRLFTLDEVEQGIFLLDESNSERTELPDGSVHISLKETPKSEGKALETAEEQEMRLHRDTGMYVHKLMIELENNTDRPVPLRVALHYLDDDLSTPMVDTMEDLNPVYVGTEVLRVRKHNLYAMTITPLLEEETSASIEPTEESELSEEPAEESSLSEHTENPSAITKTEQLGTKAGESGIKIGAVRIDNRPKWNFHVWLFAACSSVCLLALFSFRSFFFGKPERAFLLLTLLLGTSMPLSLPPNKVGFDEEAHLQAVMDMASFPSGELHISPPIMNQLLITEHNNPDAQPGTAEEMKEFSIFLDHNGNYKDGERTPNFDTMENRMPAYFSMAAAMKLAKGLGLPWTTVVVISRFANLLSYAALMYFAIKAAPIGKYLLSVIGLFPENIFLASTFSYDPFVTACLSLGFAYLMRLLLATDAEKKKGGVWVDAGMMALFFVLGCLPKAVYAPVILMGLAVPTAAFAGKNCQMMGSEARTKSKVSAGFTEKGASFAERMEKEQGREQKNRRHRLYLLLIVFLFVLLMASFILPTVIAPSETGDVRGGATSEVSQVGYILQHPFDYAVVLISQMIRWIPQCFFGADCTTFMGHLVNGSTEFKGYYPIYLFLLLWCVFLGSSVFGKEKTGGFFLQKLWMFLMIGAACVLIWTSMYVAFTVPGAREIAGVQGRYFIPLLYPLYLLFFNWNAAAGAKLAKDRLIWYDLTIWLSFFGLALTEWTTVISRFLL